MREDGLTTSFSYDDLVRRLYCIEFHISSALEAFEFLSDSLLEVFGKDDADET